jgi:hypothetical protein
MLLPDRSDAQWLQELLERAIAKNWCIRMNCTTCGSDELRRELGLVDESADGWPRFRMTADTAESIVAALKAIAPTAASVYRMDEAVMWVIYEVWRNWGDRYFGDLDGTWAGEVLTRMRAHYARRQQRTPHP